MLQVEGDRAANLRTATEIIESHAGHDLYVLPELSSSGYGEKAFQRLDQLAEDWDGPSLEVFSTLARKQSCAICYSFPRREKDGFTISAAVVDPNGELVVRYDKWHVCSTGVCCEQEYFVDGTRPPETFEINGIRIGVAICYDIRFPEIFRKLTVEHHVDLLIHPGGWPRDEGFETWHDFVRVRAMENCIYILSTNWAGPDNGSTVFCPPFAKEGNGLLGDEPGVLPGLVDPVYLSKIRETYPYLVDRKPEMY